MPGPFEPLRETLLRSGVAPLHVRRYVSELSDHFSDIVDEELKTGRSLGQARASARARLGSDAALADAMLAEPSLRSWTGRAPWATLVVGPAVLLSLAWLVPLLCIALEVGWVPGADSRPLAPEWLPAIGSAVLDLVQVAGPLLIGSGVALLAARQRSRPIWPLLGCVLVAFIGAGLVWKAIWPVAGVRQGGLAVCFHWSHSLSVGSVSLAVAAGAYWMARRRTLAIA
ncbi:MAG: hypothetical protein ACXU82_17105 [Caulobacteraceae bacterium]